MSTPRTVTFPHGVVLSEAALSVGLDKLIATYEREQERIERERAEQRREARRAQRAATTNTTPKE